MEAIVLSERQRRAWVAADLDQRSIWMDAAVENGAGVVFIAGAPAVAFLGAGDAPLTFVYEDGYHVAIAVSATDTKTLRAAAENPDYESELTDAFRVEGGAFLLDASDDSTEPLYLDLDLEDGLFYVDLRYRDDAMVLVLWLPEEEDAPAVEE